MRAAGPVGSFRPGRAFPGAPLSPVAPARTARASRASRGPAALAPVLAPALALALLLSPLMSGCGFRPRGSVAPLADPGRLFVDADRGLSVDESLRRSLLERGLVLAGNRDAADIVLRVSGERQTQRIVSIRSTGRVSEFELAHSLDMRITRPPDASGGEGGEARGTGRRDGAESDEGAAADPFGVGPGAAAADGESVDGFVADALAADRVEVTREYTYDESQVLGKENEARILRSEMGEELVRQIVLRTVASLARRSAEPAAPR